jgi:hypothetical protein
LPIYNWLISPFCAPTVHPDIRHDHFKALVIPAESAINLSRHQNNGLRSPDMRGSAMMRWLLLTFTLAAGFEAPAFAGGQYQVWQSMLDWHCLVVDGNFVANPKEPGVLAGLDGFATRAEAEAKMAELCPQEKRRQEPAAKQKYQIFQSMLDGRCRVIDADFVAKEPGAIFGGISGFATRAEAEAKLPELCKQIK